MYEHPLAYRALEALPYNRDAARQTLAELCASPPRRHRRTACVSGMPLARAGYGRDMARMRPGRLALTATVAGLALALGACGGDDKKSSDNGIKRPEYVAKVDAVCKQTTKQSAPSFRKLQALVNASGTYKSRLIKGAPTLRTVYKLQVAKLQRFKAIQPPTADRAQVAKITKAADKTLTEFRNFLPYADRGDLPKLIDIATDASGSRGIVEQLGTTYGFRKDCFSVPLDLSNFQQ
jgi:hypothetical protein